jgi:phage-related protein
MSGSRTLKLSILADVDDLKKKLDTGSKEVEGFGGKLEKFGKVAAAAFAAAAVAAAAYAGKLAIEGVKAAIEDEAAQNRLANALKNVTGATNEQIASVEKQINKMSLATGIADDQLRPAYQRLATATGSLSTANKALTLALDISAATGKSVESVSNALAKAYEGNTASLARLGVGLSAAEIKSMGLDATMKQLSQTFGGAATTQANTLEGQIARLQVAFDEAKETVGAALLPTLQRLLDFFINTVIPKFIEFKDKALKPVTDAIAANKESLTLLYNFIRQYIIPILIDGFGNALQFIGKIAGGIINVISAVVDGIKSAVEFAINAINTLIRAYNAIPFLPNVNTIQAPSVSAAPKVTAPSVPSISAASISTGVTTAPSISSSGGASKSPVSQTLIEQVTASNALKNMAPGAFDPSAVRRGDERGNINITVNGAVDPASTARQIANILNSEAAQSGSFTDLGISRFATRVE